MLLYVSTWPSNREVDYLRETTILVTIEFYIYYILIDNCAKNLVLQSLVIGSGLVEEKNKSLQMYSIPYNPISLLVNYLTLVMLLLGRGL